MEDPQAPVGADVRADSAAAGAELPLIESDSNLAVGSHASPDKPDQ